MKKLITTVLLLAGIACATALAQKQTPPPGGKPKDFVLPEKKINQLPNGVKSQMVQYGDIPKVSVQLIVKTGNVHEGPNEVWLADLTGNLLKEGTTTMDFKTISRKVAAMGGDINIGTGADQTYITCSVLSEFAPLKSPRRPWASGSSTASTWSKRGDLATPGSTCRFSPCGCTCSSARSSRDPTLPTRR